MGWYISKIRFKCALILIFGAAVIIVNALNMGMSLRELWDEYGLSAGLMAITGVFLWRPAFEYAKADAAAVWRRWGRHGRRKSKNDFEHVKFARVYANTKYGLMGQPEDGVRVRTTLESCTCRDFTREGLPCKHMCRLAHTLGLYEDEEEENE
ncbi:MAG: SWIM zinc finger domain-containing protein [Clostridiales Family XIII bacterium]|jgi:hypothetical protein|nr:SWIM zinc finger domain-containing protein [Clostridiales Family XIII bacterium]